MISAYVLVSVEPGKNRPVLEAVRKVAGVKHAHSCWGVPDIFAFVEAEDDKALAETVLSRIQSIAGIRTTETHVALPL